MKDNKYKRIYDKIIENAKKRPSSRAECNDILGYVEQHHILPVFMFKNRKLANTSGNLVFLTGREHFICHKLLIKCVDDIFYLDALFAFSMFLQNSEKRGLSSRQFEEARKAKSKANSIFRKGKTYEDLYGKQKAQEMKENLSRQAKSIKKWVGETNPNKLYGSATLGRVVPEEQKKRQRLKMLNRYDGNKNPFFGKKHTEKTKLQMRKPKPDGFGLKVSLRRLKQYNAEVYHFKNSTTNKEFTMFFCEFEKMIGKAWCANRKKGKYKEWTYYSTGIFAKQLNSVEMKKYMLT